MDEYYPGYEALSSYLKKFDNPSYRNFLDLNREEVIKSPPFTENWGGLESAWSNRFIRAVQTHIPDRFEDIKLKVCLFFIVFNFLNCAPEKVNVPFKEYLVNALGSNGLIALLKRSTCHSRSI
uniref:Uncharacterized protein n=1 Tax=Rhizophagus irregularis (strain DAOM 181602 / DAOM 197198 / MUCL 43194) TaxID=747089 RepID=U9SRH1_RHIID